MVEKIDHKKQAQDLLLYQFRNSETLTGLLNTWMTIPQEMEDSLHNFLNGNSVVTATGLMLDILGEQFGVYRELREDDEYRAAILARSILQRTDGTTEKFYQSMEALCQTNNVDFHEYYPRGLYAQVGNGYNQKTVTQLKDARQAGITFRLLIDHNLDSLKLAEIIERDNNLITGNLDDYVVIVDGITYNLTTNISGSEVLDDTEDYLAELFDTEFFPMADLLIDEPFQVTSLLVDDIGNFIIDNEGNRFYLTEYEYT